VEYDVDGRPPAGTRLQQNGVPVLKPWLAWPWQAFDVERLVRLAPNDAGGVLTVQRAAYVTEAQAHHDLDPTPLRQDLAPVAAELGEPDVLVLGRRYANGRLVAAVRARAAGDPSVVWGEVAHLTVAPHRQGPGLGSNSLRLLSSSCLAR
jgi:hypothetical protein